MADVICAPAGGVLPEREKYSEMDAPVFRSLLVLLMEQVNVTEGISAPPFQSKS